MLCGHPSCYVDILHELSLEDSQNQLRFRLTILMFLDALFFFSPGAFVLKVLSVFFGFFSSRRVKNN